MPQANSEVDVAVIGAGVAGLAAAKALQAADTSFVLLEASHRIGGRAYTEMLEPGVPFDLGAHWIHSADINPFVQIAKDLNITTVKETEEFPWARFCEDGAWLPDTAADALFEFYEQQIQAVREAFPGCDDRSVYDVIKRQSRWSPYFDLFFAQDFGHDADQVSAIDAARFRWMGADWAVAEGFGELVARFAADVPVSLNSAVHEIDWSGPGVRLKTQKGNIRARKVIVTVSTGVLATRQIRFAPRLPDWKTEAFDQLTMGHCTRVGLTFAGSFLSDLPAEFTVRNGDDAPLHFRNRPFGRDYVEVTTGGRCAEWMEKSGEKASIDFILHKLKDVAGSDADLKVRKHIVTAWTGDAWTKGAYSCASPGYAHVRSRYSESIDDKVLFAGEAGTLQHYSTVHGALFSGRDAAAALLATRKSN